MILRNSIEITKTSRKFLIAHFFQNISELFVSPLDVTLADVSVLYIEQTLSEKGPVILDAAILGAETETFYWKLVIRRWYLSLSNSLHSQIPRAIWKWLLHISFCSYSPILSGAVTLSLCIMQLWWCWGCSINKHLTSLFSWSVARMPGTEEARLWTSKTFSMI